MYLSLVTETLLFFKKLKYQRKLRKLNTDLATTKHDAAITVLELREKIRTLCEEKAAPRGQYYHVTVACPPPPGSWVVCIVYWQQSKKQGCSARQHSGLAAC